MSTAIYKFAPTGNPGDVTRLQETLVEPNAIAAAFAGFGLPAKFNSTGELVPVESGDAATVFKGILTRIVPSISGSVAEGFTDGQPVVGQTQGLARKGYVLVNCKVGTPVKGGIVYMRVTAATGKLVGDFEATADGANSVALPNVEWAASGKDAQGSAEIFLK